MKKFPHSLLAGYQNFLAESKEKPQIYRLLAKEGQQPETMVIGCCDSRVAPEIIFNMGPGDVFVTRNIANQVPPYQPDGHFHATSAALEYAVKGLKVKHIIVLGHSGCGGIQAALDTAKQADIGQDVAQQKAACSCCGSSDNGAHKTDNNNITANSNIQKETPHQPKSAQQSEGEKYDFIGDWMQLLKPAADEAAANALMTQFERRQALEKISLRSSIKNLRGFPWIKEAEDSGLLTLHAAWFDIASAELWIMDNETEEFVLLS